MDLKYICCIYATAPFLLPEYLIKGLTYLQGDNSLNYSFSATNFSFPIQRAIKLKNNKVEMFQPEHLNSRSQDLEVAYHDVGQFYFFKPETALEKGKLWTDNSGIIEINELNAQDIDTETDWKLAEIKYQLALEK